ncbi:MAG: hypothetical protein H0X28_01675 [Solirubrobacterales bacterium]|nr:hypothetical protein [Solirubrobacterales bacterium]
MHEDERRYVPDYALLQELLAVPIQQGHSRSQRSGRVAKSLDAYVAHELRRAGFDPSAVFPRLRMPRALAPEMRELEEAIGGLASALAEYEAAAAQRLKPASLRAAINRVSRVKLGSAETNVLGRFYTKQVDAMVLADWLRGPDVLVSGKTQFSSYLKNKNNRYEEAIGEAHNLRERYPLAAMGFMYLVRSTVFDDGAYELLRDLLVRLRRPDGPFDATVLLVADWDAKTLKLSSVEDPAPSLALPKFFEDLLEAVISYMPVDIHPEMRRRKAAASPPAGPH